AAAGMKNIPLSMYSVQQVFMSKEDKMNELKRFFPNAKKEDCNVLTAEKRVQVINDESKSNHGIIHFGTEVVNSDDRTLSALLGESPGASTSVSVLLEVLEDNFPVEFQSKWMEEIKRMMPSYGIDLNEDIALLEQVWDTTNKYLELN